MTKHYIICQKCKTANQNSDYCYHCGEIINVVLKRELEQENYKREKEQEQKEKQPTKAEKLIKKLKNHPNAIVRTIFYVFHSMGMVVFVLAASIALIIGALLL